jgi:hypothetical protein
MAKRAQYPERNAILERLTTKLEHIVAEAQAHTDLRRRQRDRTLLVLGQVKRPFSNLLYQLVLPLHRVEGAVLPRPGAPGPCNPDEEDRSGAGRLPGPR